MFGIVSANVRAAFRQSSTRSWSSCSALNNYVANQVFLEIGGNRLGGPVIL
jgi:hypothetical protein